MLQNRPGFSSGIFKDLTVNTLHILPSNPDLMVVTVKGHYAFLVHATGGQLIRTFSTGNEKGGDFLCATLSPQGKWLYCGAEDGTLYVFDVQGGALDSKLTISGDDSKGGGSKQEVIGVSHHPHRNILVTITDIGQLRVWRP